MTKTGSDPISSSEYVQFDEVLAGECVAGTARAIMGTADVSLLWLKAYASNAGTVFVGGSAVTASDGTADATTGRPMAAGDEWGPIPVTNISCLYVIASAAAQQVSWWGLK